MSGSVEPQSSAYALPKVWRIPPWQPAALILLAAVLLALVIYGHFSLGLLLMMTVIAVAALGAAAYWLRLLLVADDQGIWVRHVFSEQLTQWRDIAVIEVTHVRGTTITVRIVRANGTFVDVPPSLVQPVLPTGVRKAHGAIASVARRLQDIADEQRRAPH